MCQVNSVQMNDDESMCAPRKRLRLGKAKSTLTPGCKVRDFKLWKSSLQVLSSLSWMPRISSYGFNPNPHEAPSTQDGRGSRGWLVGDVSWLGLESTC